MLGAVCAGLLSVIVQYFALQRLRRQPSHVVEFAALVTTLGADLVLTSTAQKISDAQTVRFPFRTLPIAFFDFLGLRISLLQIVVLVSVAVLMAFLLYTTCLAQMPERESAGW